MFSGASPSVSQCIGPDRCRGNTDGMLSAYSIKNTGRPSGPNNLATVRRSSPRYKKTQCTDKRTQSTIRRPSAPMDQTSQSEKILQKEKFDEIIQILLSAGYFRARINTLSEFDKVVGGLCWCITSSGEDVDVDILFQENSTIGQKITLSEAIVKALRKMNCPAQIQPHQIQGGVGGSDYPAILPVIVWLVKKFFEIRQIREAQLRAVSVFQFGKNYQLPSEDNIDGVSNDLKKILKRNKAVRSYRRKESKHESEITRVHSCLLEYGDSFLSNTMGDSKDSQGKVRISVSTDSSITLTGSDLSGFEKKLAQMAKEAQKEEALFAEHASKEEAELMRQMSQLQGENNLSGSHVGSIVGIGHEEIGNASAAYLADIEEAKKLLDANLATGKLGQLASYKRQKQNLLKLKEEVEAKAAGVQSAVTSILDKLSSIQKERDHALEYNVGLKAMVAKLTELELSSSQQEELAMLKHLITLNESLKAQEAAFKASCKAQLQDLQEKIKSMDEGDDNGDDAKKFNDIEDMHNKMLAKYNRLRQLLAETNLEISNSSRIIDDIPTRTELIQYERRFVELYSQVAWKLEETRKYYALYNTLDTTLNFLSKEVKLLNSISENFNDAMTSTQTKAEYLKQIDQIVRGVEDSLVRQEGILKGKEKTLEELKSNHQNLVDEQRRYFKAVKDFQEECNKNEWLTNKLQSLGVN